MTITNVIKGSVTPFTKFSKLCIENNRFVLRCTKFCVPNNKFEASKSIEQVFVFLNDLKIVVIFNFSHSDKLVHFCLKLLLFKNLAKNRSNLCALKLLRLLLIN